MKPTLRQEGRLILALVCAPVIALISISFAGCMLGASSEQGQCLANIDGFVLFAGIPVLCVLLAFGLPLILVSIRLGFVNAWHYLVGGGLLGLVSAFGLVFIDSGLAIEGLGPLASAIGATTALIVWSIGIRGNIMPTQSPV